MTQPKRRFWTEVTVLPGSEGGHAVLLDGRPLHSPAKRALALPSRALAEAVAEEWQAQGAQIDPGAMPLTRAANSALDKVAPQHAAVVQMLAEYGASDLLCYRAEAPEGLVARQTAAWDPWLAWARDTLGAPLVQAQGVMHVPQPQESLDRLAARLAAEDAFRLTALHDLVTLSGSLILGLAVADRALDAAEGWDLSRIDETWQEEQWGRDDEAHAMAQMRREAFLTAERMLRLLEHSE